MSDEVMKSLGRIEGTQGEILRHVANLREDHQNLERRQRATERKINIATGGLAVAIVVVTTIKEFWIKVFS